MKSAISIVRLLRDLQVISQAGMPRCGVRLAQRADPLVATQVEELRIGRAFLPLLLTQEGGEGWGEEARFCLDSPLLGPLPTRASWSEEDARSRFPTCVDANGTDPGTTLVLPRTAACQPQTTPVSPRRPSDQGQATVVLPWQVSLQNYFTANAAQQNAPLNLTPARAAQLFTALSDARRAAADGNTDSGQKKNLRDAAVAALRTRMSGLVNELGQLLEADDPLWLAFGLNLPGATDLPDPADSLVLTAGGPGVVLADWSDASRATRYRVFKQVLTVNANFVAVDTVNDSDCTLSGLPSGKTVRVQIVSANDAGQGQPSAAAEIVVP